MQIVTVSYTELGYTHQVRLSFRDEERAFAVVCRPEVMGTGTKAMVKALIMNNTGYLAQAESFSNGKLIEIKYFDEQGAQITRPRRSAQQKLGLGP